METSEDRRSRLRDAHRQLTRAELYVVAARELVGPGSEPGQAIERLREDLLALAEDLRAERRLQRPVSRPLRAIAE